MKSVPCLNWSDTADHSNPIANLVIDFTIDGDWIIHLPSIYRGQPIYPAYVDIDNSANVASSAVITVKSRGRIWTVKPIYRLPLTLPKGEQTIEFTAPGSGIQVPVAFYAKNPVSDFLVNYAGQFR